MDDALLDDPVGVSKCRIHVAAGHRMRVGDVRLAIRMGFRRALLDRLFRIHDHRKRIVVHDDRVERVARDIRIRGDDDRDGVPDEVDPIAGKRGVLRRVRAGQLGSARHSPTFIVDVCSGEHAGHAGDLPRGADIYRGDAGVRVRTTQNGSVQHAGQPQVVHERGEAFDETRIFDALHRAADVGRGVSHERPPRSPDAPRR